MKVNGVAQAFWNEVLAGSESQHDRPWRRDRGRQNSRLIRTVSGRVRREGAKP